MSPPYPPPLQAIRAIEIALIVCIMRQCVQCDIHSNNRRICRSRVRQLAQAYIPDRVGSNPDLSKHPIIWRT